MEKNGIDILIEPLLSSLAFADINVCSNDEKERKRRKRLHVENEMK